MRNRIIQIAVFAAIVASPVALRAQQITFSSLSGPLKSPFTAYVESGYAITKTAGSMCMALSFGNPVPAVFSGALDTCPDGAADGNGTFSITKVGGGLFTFYGFDAASNSGNTDYSILGTNGATGVFSQSGTLLNTTNPDPTFAFLQNNADNLLVDKVVVQLKATTARSWNVDNVTVNRLPGTTVPEPASVALVGAGLAALALARRKRQV